MLRHRYKNLSQTPCPYYSSLVGLAQIQNALQYSSYLSSLLSHKVFQVIQ